MQLFFLITICCYIVSSFAEGIHNNNSDKITNFNRTTSTNGATISAISLLGIPKYDKKEFKYFDYVNPDAPKMGTFKTIEIGSFDSLNIFTNKGIAASSVSLIYDTLMVGNKEEPATAYPLIAESLQILENNKGVIFNLNPNAKFHDNHPITAEDVEFTFKLLVEKGNVLYRSYYTGVSTVVVLDKHKIQFNFNQKNNHELTFILSELPVLPKHFWMQPDNDFFNSSLTIPLGSGPYKIYSVDAGRSITLKRVDDYWAKDLAVNKGRYNFDFMLYDYFLDINIAREALKSNKYDFFREITAKNWETFKTSVPIKNKSLIMKQIPSLNTAPVQGFIFNQRKNKFKNIYVRQALTYLLDFEKINHTLFNNSYLRTESFFPNSPMSAIGIPSDAELELLKPWKHMLPEELFSKPFTLPNGNLRERKLVALDLFQKAGYSLKNGKLVDHNEEEFTIDFLSYSNLHDNVIFAFSDYLKYLGISVSIRSLDSANYYNSIRNFDFDMIIYAWGQSQSPGNEQYFFWGSEFVDTPNTKNLAGINNQVVDAMIDNIIKAKNSTELYNSVKALDRVLLWGYNIIPNWYFPFNRVIFSNSIVIPSNNILYGMDINSWYFKKNNNTVVKQTPPKNTFFNKNNTWLLVLIICSVFWFVRSRKKQSKQKIKFERC